MMSPELGIGLIIALVGPGSLVFAWYTNRQRKNDPITQGEAERAWINDALGAITTSRNVVIEDNKRLSTRMDAFEVERKKDRDDIAALRQRVTLVEKLSGSALRYIDILLRHIIAAVPGASIPTPENELIDYIDPELHLWVTEQQRADHESLANERESNHD